MNARAKAAECAANGDTAGERYWNSVADTVDAAPPLSQSQISKLRVLLHGSNATAATAEEAA